MEIFSTPEFWVAVSFLIFAGLLVYYGVPGMITSALDKRAETIKRELETARKLREDAQKLLADYQKKAREAGAEAQAIIDQAKREAGTLAAETRRSLADQLERRTKLAEEKIARAETQAMNEVRGRAVDAAIAAAKQVVQGRVAGAAQGAALVDESIRDVAKRMN